MLRAALPDQILLAVAALTVVLALNVRCAAREVKTTCAELSSECNANADFLKNVTSLKLRQCRGVLKADVFENCDFSYVTRVDLANNTLEGVEQEAFVSLRHIRGLTLESNRISNIQPRAFANLTHLQVLNMSENALTELRSDMFSGLERLKQLRLRKNKLESLPAAVFSKLEELELLLLTYNHISQIPPTAFSGLSRLQDLLLYYNNITQLDTSVFRALTRVRVIDLYGNQLTSLESKLFRKLLLLEELYLDKNRITRIASDAFDTLPQLLTVSLDRNNLTQMPFQIFDQPSLREVELSNNQITSWNATQAQVTLGRHFSIRLSLQGNPLKYVVDRTPNVPGFQVSVFLQDTMLRDPRDINNMGLSGPAFILDRGSHVNCVPRPQKEQEDYGPTSIITHCECSKNFRRLNGRCVNQTPLIVGLSAAFCSAICAAIVGVYLYRKLRHDRAAMRYSIELKERLLAEKETDIEALRSAWRIDASEVKLLYEVDKGAFGEVWKASMGSITVAIKILHDTVGNPQQEQLEAFGQEIEFLMRCRHLNIVRFFGAGQLQGKPFIAMEYLAHGSLKDFLRDPLNGIDWPVRLRMAREIAQGLEYIHSLGKMHRDVKTANVLLDSDLRCKVTDFGTVKQIMSRRGLDRTRNKRERSFSLHSLSADMGDRGLTCGRGTPLYMAPEVIRGRDYDFSADVFSYSIVLWELAARRRPDLVDELGLDSRGPFLSTLLGLLEEGHRLPLPETQELPKGAQRPSSSSSSGLLPPATRGSTASTFSGRSIVSAFDPFAELWPAVYVDVMTRGWTTDPSARPRFTEICDLLQSNTSTA